MKQSRYYKLQEVTTFFVLQCQGRNFLELELHGAARKELGGSLREGLLDDLRTTKETGLYKDAA